MTRGVDMELEIAVLSKTGGRTRNEDACGCWSDDEVCFCVLSDGAGGHRGGDVASRLVVREILGWLRERHECSGEAVEAAMRAANVALVSEQRATPQLSDMRATVVVLAIDFQRDVAAWGHLGDSRLYCFRDRAIAARTRDHSVVQSMVDAGYLRPEDVRTSPDRSKLLGAMGDEEDFAPGIQRERFALRPGDKFLLCTDGVWEYMEDEELVRVLEECGSAEDWLRALEACVLARASERHDNYSAVALWCK